MATTAIDPDISQLVGVPSETKLHAQCHLQCFGACIRKHLARVTSSGHYIAEIDGLRFVAIAWVVMFHLRGFIDSRTGITFSNSFTWVISQGQLGVLLFFAISGFILGLPFAAHRLLGASEVSLQRYFLRRVTRLEPPYVFSLVFATAMLATAYSAGLVPHLHWLTYEGIAKRSLASLFYCHSLVYGELNPINWVLWSLETEIQFYISMPVLGLLFRISSHSIRHATWLALIGATAYVGTTCFLDSWRFHHSLAGNAQYFIAGLFLADIYTSYPSEAAGRSVFWDITALPAWLCLPFLFAAPVGRIYLPLAILVAYAGVLWGKHLRRLFRNVYTTTIGGMCYSIYLYHYLIILAIGPLTLRLPRAQTAWIDHAVQYALLMPAILVLSAIAFAVLERPFMAPNWPLQLRRKYRPEPIGQPN